jgi:outer membrane protein assembly factor BamB
VEIRKGSSLPTVTLEVRMRILRTICGSAIVLAALALSGCGPSAGTFELSPNPAAFKRDSIAVQQVTDKAQVVTSTFSFSDESEIKQVDIHDSLSLALIRYEQSNGKSGFLLYDFEKDAPRWHAESDMTFEVMRNDDLLLRGPAGPRLYEAATGQFLRKAEPGLYLLEGKTSLIIRSDTFAVVNINTGQRIWNSPGCEWKGERQVVRGDSVTLYVIAEGVHTLDIKNGRRWQYLTPTSWTNVGKELATTAAVACLSLGTVVKNYNPDVTMHMNSLPLIDGDALFFAARDKMVRLDKRTGKEMWTTEIDPELEGMTLVNLSESEVLLVGMGVKIINNVRVMAAPPSLRVISKVTGKIRASHLMEDPAIVQDVRVVGQQIYLLTAAELIILNTDLKRLNVIATKAEYGSYSDLLSTAGDTLVLRSTKGIVALDGTSLKELWFQYSEVPPVLGVDEEIAPYYESARIAVTSFRHAGYYWTINESGGLNAYDLKNGERVLQTSLLSTRLVEFRNHRYAVDFDKNRLKILEIK